MSAFLSRLCGDPDWAALPVAVLSCYQNTDYHNAAYAQGQLALTPQSLFIRLLAFEADTLESSRLVAILGSIPQQLEITIAPSGFRAVLLKNGQVGEPIPEAVFSPVAGEDLQGIYWGAQVQIPVSCLPFPVLETLPGNLYKQGDGEHPHRGSLFPITVDCLWAAENLGEFLAVNY